MSFELLQSHFPIDLLSNVYIRSDLKGTCKIASSSIYELTGYLEEELVGRCLVDFAVNPNKIETLIQRLLEGHKVLNFEFEIMRKDDHSITVMAMAQLIRGKNGEVIEAEGFIREVHSGEKEDRNQIQNEEYFKNIFETMIDVYARADKHGNCIIISPSIFDLTGYSPQEIMGKNYAEFFKYPDDWRELNQELLKRGDLRNIESVIRRKDGSVITIASNAKVVYDNHGNPLRIESVFRDVSKRKDAENLALEYQKRLRELSFELTVFEERIRKEIAVDLHDHVGQLLTSIRMQMESIIDREENNNTAVQLRHISKTLLKTIQATRAAIFDLSPPQLNEIGLAAAVHDWATSQIERKYDLNVEFLGESESFNLDETTRHLLFRTIKELAMNVLKHAHANNLVIEYIKRDNEILEISVMDDGIGFNYDPDVFRLRLKAFGLFSIQERISNLGGVLEVNSEINQGTKIIISIPV